MTATTRTQKIWNVISGIMGIAERTHLSLIAAGVAFFGVFAIFPAMAALIAVFGLVADPVAVEHQLSLMDEIIPDEAYGLFAAQIERLLQTQTGTLGWATALSLGIALWSSRAGVAALMSGLNAIQGSSSRGGLWGVIVALLLTLALVGIACVALLVVVVAPILLALIPMPAFTAWLLEAVRWFVALTVLMTALGLLYRFGPNRRGARESWITPGAVLVVVLWLAASAGFSVYLTNFGSYNEVYGSIGAVVALLMWFYISAFLILLGAALNVTLERRRAERGSEPEGETEAAHNRA